MTYRQGISRAFSRRDTLHSALNVYLPAAEAFRSGRTAAG
jgi:hypothetical protein